MATKGLEKEDTGIARKRLAKQYYTVGWICALPQPEWKASRILLDEVHEDAFLSCPTTHQYVYGSMNGHNVVMGCLPATQMGTASAAAVAAEMSLTFPSLRFGLLVGIGGGVPGNKDIRLGDVVVSQPDPVARHGGVVQYDFGKAIHRGEFQPTGMLNQPPEILLSALGKVQSTPRKESRFDQYLYHEDFEDEPEFAERPKTDQLFNASYCHGQEKLSCTDCDASQVIDRRSRRRAGPVVHYGLIASGNQVMKDAAKRDIISIQNQNVLCFEMEAAGLMNRFPCLVIRGICDYCDSHKNKEWQPSAAVAAAAWAKQLLFNIAPSQVEAEKSIKDTLENIEQIGYHVQADTKETKQVVTAQFKDHRRQQIDKWLSPPDPSTNHNDAKRLRHPDTGRWFLDSHKYRDWNANPNNALWLYGIPGCGKTILSSTIIEDQKASAALSTSFLLYFYFDFNDSSKQSFEKMLRSLISQLYLQHEPSRQHLDQLYSSCRDGKEQPPTQALITTFQSMTESAKNVVIALDALDECDARRDLLIWLASQKPESARILLTSRKEGDIDASLSQWIPAAVVVPIEQSTVDEDIRQVVRSRIAEDEDLQRWKDKPEVQDEIEIALMEKAGGMFRWAACQLDVLKGCLHLPSLRKALSSLPEDLDGTYSRILENISKTNKGDAIRVLQFLTFSERPLQLAEAIDAIAVNPEEDPAFEAQNRMPNLREIARVCSSLVKIVARPREQKFGSREDESGADKSSITELQLAHFSVKEYLISVRVAECFKAAFNEPDARAVIVEVTIAYLLAAAQNTSKNNGRETLPLKRFAAQYWMTHAGVAEGGGNHIWPCIKKLFTRQGAYRFWLGNFNPDRPSENPEAICLGTTLVHPLYYTSLGGLSISVKSLLEEGADVNALGGDYCNALQAASLGGHVEIVRLLLGNGADVKAQGGYYGNALQAASYGGHDSVVEILIDAGADANAQGGRYGNALQAASFRGYEQVVETLIAAGAEVNARGGAYSTALQAASWRGHKSVVIKLLANGADANAQGGRYGNALQAASFRGHEQVVETLIAAGAEVNAHGGEFSNALQAAVYRYHENVVTILLEAKANVNSADSERLGNILQAASYRGHERVVERLIRAGADVNAPGKHFGDALQAASNRGFSNVVQKLLAAGAEVNAPGGHFGNPLQAASHYGHVEVVRMLIKAGANVNTEGGVYGNALQAALKGGHEKVIEMLIAAEAHTRTEHELNNI